MKHYVKGRVTSALRYRPLRGAWIETGASPRPRCPPRLYRPLRGAWIETISCHSGLSRIWYRPLRGAWIETPAIVVGGYRPPRIAPYGGRGLKRMKPAQNASWSGIAPYGGRGLKRMICIPIGAQRCIAPYGGRGLKLSPSAAATACRRYRPLRGAWIETAAARYSR